MSLDTDIAYLALTSIPLDFGPAPALNNDVPTNGGRALVPATVNLPSTAQFVKIGDQTDVDPRRGAYKTYNASCR
ncbi:hypothetical protein MMC21_001376 [Puttea exsequens]|nr:hypothetical protein [Puttea exsequens]